MPSRLCTIFGAGNPSCDRRRPAHRHRAQPLSGRQCRPGSAAIRSSSVRSAADASTCRARPASRPGHKVRVATGAVSSCHPPLPHASMALPAGAQGRAGRDCRRLSDGRAARRGIRRSAATIKGSVPRAGRGVRSSRAAGWSSAPWQMQCDRQSTLRAREFRTSRKVNRRSTNRNTATAFRLRDADKRPRQALKEFAATAVVLGPRPRRSPYCANVTAGLLCERYRWRLLLKAPCDRPLQPVLRAWPGSVRLSTFCG